MDSRKGGRRKNLHGLLGVAMLAVAQVLLFTKAEPVASWFYYFAWWPYILIIDSLIFRVKGNSLLMDRRGEFAFLLCSSAVLWTFFEAVNLVIQNWYYVNVIPLVLIRWPGYFIAFATVLPGLFETTELLEACGLFSGSRVAPRQFSRAAHRILCALGIICMASVFLFPDYCFALTWCCLTFMLEPLNYHGGAKSLLRDWEQGSPRTFMLLLTAGLICGMLWEFWNFWATTKWIYTVPFFEELKLFEMPLLGFLGFPPFAVECYVLYNCISLFRHRRSWEEDTYGLNRDKKVHSGLRVAAPAACTLFCLVTFAAMDARTVNSYWSSLGDVHIIPPAAAARLGELGIGSPRELLRRASTGPERDALAGLIGVQASTMVPWLKAAELSCLKGMGARNASLLISAEISDAASLARERPEDLHQRLTALYRSSPGAHALPPRVPVIRVWIREAQRWTLQPG